MYIHEAVSAAVASGGYIKRSGPVIWRKCKIRPGNTGGGCLLYSDFQEAPCPRWQPKAEDLMADDWVLLSGD